MKVKDLLKMDIEIDVYDDVCEELAICFCAPQELTEEGYAHFAEVLEYPIEIDTTGQFSTAVVKIDGDDGNKWKKRLRKAEEFFYSAAGYCADTDYQKWFTDETMEKKMYFFQDAFDKKIYHGEYACERDAKRFAEQAGLRFLGEALPIEMATKEG